MFFSHIKQRISCKRIKEYRIQEYMWVECSVCKMQANMFFQCDEYLMKAAWIEVPTELQPQQRSGQSFTTKITNKIRFNFKKIMLCNSNTGFISCIIKLGKSTSKVHKMVFIFNYNDFIGLPDLEKSIGRSLQPSDPCI